MKNKKHSNNSNEIYEKKKIIMEIKNMVIARQHNTKSMQLSGKLKNHAPKIKLRYCVCICFLF